jgi:hypothetical protein
MGLSDRKFAVLILTHGRPDSVVTDKTLRRSGYTGPIWYLIDNEDKSANEYRERYGSSVIQFDKRRYADMVDEGDNFDNRRTTTHVRNASFDIAEELGLDWFWLLDDDYLFFEYRTNSEEQYPAKMAKINLSLDAIIQVLIEFIEPTRFATVAMAQGGDFILAKDTQFSFNPTIYRKAMNSFLLSPHRRFWFVSRLNEDVNTYCTEGMRGTLMGTVPLVSLTQRQTQSQAGGMTEAYKASGTYVKSFSTVMYCPAFARVQALNTSHARIHHRIDWKRAVPVIIGEEHASEAARRKRGKSNDPPSR